MILNTKKKPLRVPSFFFLCGDFISVTHDFQHTTTMNCQTQSSLSRVENHAEEIKNYYDGNEVSEARGLRSCTRRITTFTFETNLEIHVIDNHSTIYCYCFLLKIFHFPLNFSTNV